MLSFAYSFCISLLHSFWQAALLWLVYVAISKSSGTKFTPAQKRNLLFVFLTSQTVLFIVTFCLYYIKPYAASTILLNFESLTNIVNQKNTESIAVWLFTMYALLVAYKLIKAVYSWWFFKKHYKHSLVKPSVELKLFTELNQYKFGIKRKVQLWLSQHANTPLTFGFLKPIIILPIALVNQLSVKQTETLILHELAHIKANDFLVNWFVIAIETIFFFNPFISSLCKQLKLEREKNCDITVTAFNYNPLLYAEALFQAQAIKQMVPAALINNNFKIAAVNKPATLLNRIQFFVNPDNQLKAAKNKILVPICILLIVLFTSFAVLLQLNSVKQQTNESAVGKKYEPAAKKGFDEIFPAITNNVLNKLTDENLQKITKIIEKQQPLIEAEIKKLQPLIKEIETKAETIAEEFENSIITPVTFPQNIIERSIVVKEEESGSKNATIKIYSIIYKDGKWLLQPQWKMSAKEIIQQDSIKIIDTSNLNPHSPEESEFQD